VDWSGGGGWQVLCDVGDVPLGLHLEEALARLGDNVADIIRRGGVPLVLGGSGDMSYANAAGLMTVAGGNIGIISVDSQLNVTPQRSESKIQTTSASRLLLSDTRFCPPREGLMSEPWCDGKFVQVGAQGMQCSSEEVSFVEERGGKVLWLSKDIRQVNPFAPSQQVEVGEVSDQLVKHGSRPDTPPSCPPSAPPSCCPCCHSSQRLLTLLKPLLTHLKGISRKRPIYLSLHMEALHDTVLPGVSSRSYDGLSAEEAMQLCSMAGADQNVAIFDICGLNPDIEEVRSPMFVAQLAYSFILGFLRRAGAGNGGGGGGGEEGGTPPPSALL
jgi:arginase family enzyme